MKRLYRAGGPRDRSIRSVGDSFIIEDLYLFVIVRSVGNERKIFGDDLIMIYNFFRSALAWEINK